MSAAVWSTLRLCPLTGFTGRTVLPCAGGSRKGGGDLAATGNFDDRAAATNSG